jgi:acylphosphatase
MMCYHYWVSGRVQGVYFRAFTEKTARELGLCGWVKNLPDGRVETLACGNLKALEQFEAALWQGPPRAKVEKVEKKEEQQMPCSNDFYIIE